MFKIRIVKNLFQQKGLNMFALRTDKKYAQDFLSHLLWRSIAAPTSWISMRSGQILCVDVV